MSSLQKVQEARERIKSAREVLEKESEATIKETVESILSSNPDIDIIRWGHRSSEYDDEGMYPGIVGPIVQSREEFDAEDNYPDWIYRDEYKSDKRLSTLVTALNSIGEDILSDLYGDQAVVTIERSWVGVCESCKQPLPEKSGFLISSESRGY